MKAFGMDDQTEICKLILAKGELQISDKERQSQNEQLFKDIATTLASICLNPELKRPYPVTIIEKAMKDAHYSVKPNQATKVQAMAALKLLKQADIIPIERAKMRIKVQFGGKEAKKLKQKILKLESVQVESEEQDEELITLVFVVDPGQFKEISALITSETKGKGLLEVLAYKEIVLGDEFL